MVRELYLIFFLIPFSFSRPIIFINRKTNVQKAIIATLGIA